FASARDGTQVAFSILSGPGSFPDGSSCTTSGGTGSCEVTLTSSSAGTTTVRAGTDVTVGGLTLHRATGDGHARDAEDATNRWVDARIAIASSATNEVGRPHTFTATLEKDSGSGFVPAAGESMTVTLTGANGASPFPARPFICVTDSSGQCAVP